MTGRGGGNRGTHGSQDKDEEEIEARHGTSGCYGGMDRRNQPAIFTGATHVGGPTFSPESMCDRYVKPECRPRSST